MGDTATGTTADIVESKLRLVAWAMLCFALGTGLEASHMLLTGMSAQVVDGASMVFYGSAVLIVLHLMWWKFRGISEEDRHLFSDPEGYVGEVLKRSCSRSWTLTFLLLIMMSVLDRTLERLDLPVEFFVKLVLCFMLLSFSWAFLVYFGDDQIDEDGVDPT